MGIYDSLEDFYAQTWRYRILTVTPHTEVRPERTKFESRQHGRRSITHFIRI